MRGIVFAASLALGFWSGSAPAADPPTEPGFRLLILDGRPVRWTLPNSGPNSGQAASVSYAFLARPASFSGARNCSKMLPPTAALDRSGIEHDAFRREVRAAFDLWQGAANIKFEETDDLSRAGILIGAEAEPIGRAFTNVAPHGTAGVGVDGIAQSLICLNPETPWKIGFDGNLDVYDLRYTIAHEIGHAIGLDHPSPEGQLMSFRYVEHDRGLRPGDIAGAAALYGRKSTSTADANAAAPFASSPAASTGGVDRARGVTFGLGEVPPRSPAR